MYRKVSKSLRLVAVRGLLALALSLSGVAVLAGSASAADVGFVGHAYTGTTAPTGEKPQSKLWHAHGSWWGSLWSLGAATATNPGDFNIFRFDWAANAWVDTGVRSEPQQNSTIDTLFDGDKLYILSTGKKETFDSHSAEVRRFSFLPTENTWELDSGFPVRVMAGGAEAPVLDKDTTGTLWVTYTRAVNPLAPQPAGTLLPDRQVWLTHSVGNDDTNWVPPYVLPTPADESLVDPDDISALVAHDGDMIGVLWSNQKTEKMYWSSHRDGASDDEWSAPQVAYDQPEGADDHINLKSVTGSDSGRVFAVVKTSMNGDQDPLLNVLKLSVAGGWSAHLYSTVSDDLTRGTVVIDSQNGELWVFAAGPCCAGGTVYYKKTSLVNPSFGAGKGTVLISSATHPKANNPTSTKQTVNNSTGLLVLAGDDETRTYLFNKVGLPLDTVAPDTTLGAGGPEGSTTATDATFDFTSEADATFGCALDGAPASECSSPTLYQGLAAGTHTFTVYAVDTAGNIDPTPASRTWTVQSPPPQTTIDSGPSGETTLTEATFGFSSSESGGTFRCSLGESSATSCTSPQKYGGLAAGSHTFTVYAIDMAGNVDATPATRTWTVLKAPAPVLPLFRFRDDFSSGSLASDGWRVFTGGDGTARVATGAVRPGDRGVILRSSARVRSTASIRKGFGSGRSRMTFDWDAVVRNGGQRGQTVSLFKVYNSAGKPVLSLNRRSATRRLIVRDLAGTTRYVRGPAVGRVAHYRLSVVQNRGGRDTWTLKVNGRVLAQNSSSEMGRARFTGFRFGDPRRGRVLDFRVDNVRVD